MTQLTNLMIFLIVITLKCQFTKTEFDNDYFNHHPNALPEFLVGESLLTTKKLDFLENLPWITRKGNTTVSATTVKPTTKSTSSTTTFETKVRWVNLPSSIETMRTDQNNGTDVLLPFWSRLPSSVFINPTIEFTTNFTTGSSTTSTPKSTTNSTTNSTTKQTTRTTLNPTTKSTSRSTVNSTTRQVSKTTTSRQNTLYATRNPFHIVPIWTPRFAANLSLITKTTNTMNPEAINAPIWINANKTAASTGQYFEAQLNKVRPFNPTIATLQIPTVFQDLTLKRSGLDDNESKVKFIDEGNQPYMPEVEPIVDVVDKRQQMKNKFQYNEAIEYRVLATEPFSKFLEFLMRQLAIMDAKYAEKFLRTFERQLVLLINSGAFDDLGPATRMYLREAITGFQFPIEHKQRLFSMAHNILATRNDTLGPELNSLLDYMDMLYAVRAEELMERVLNETKAYPKVSKTAEEITEGFIEDVLLNPLKKISGTIQGNKLVAAIEDIVTNKKAYFNARRGFSGNYYLFPKKSKDIQSLHKHHVRKSKRPKLVLTTRIRKKLRAENNWIQTRRTKEDIQRMTTYYRNSNEEDSDFIETDSEESNIKNNSKNEGKTEIYSLGFVNRANEIRKDGRKFREEFNNSNADEKRFRAFYNMKQNNMVNNPFRTLLYGFKDRENRFENSNEQTRTRPTTKATIAFSNNRYKKKEEEYFGKQSTHESKTYHKEELNYNKREKNKVNENFVKKSIISETNSHHTYQKHESKDSDEEFATITTLDHKPDKVKETKPTHHFPKPLNSVHKNKSKATETQDTETTQSEFKEANVSLKHFYFKPVIIQNKSGDDNQFVSIELDGVPNIIDFSMKVKLKRPIPITQPAAQIASKGQRSRNVSESTTAKTNMLRVLNPYKMDNYFKNNGTEHNGTVDDKGSSADSSESSSQSDDTTVSLEGKSHVFGKLRKIEHHGHKKEKLRSKKHKESKKRHHKRKYEKRKGHHRHEKHGKKHRHKFLETYLKKIHDKKKRIKHKLKQLEGKRIVGKNFKIDFGRKRDSDEKNLIHVTIVERAKDGKRATMSLVNKGKKLSSSDSSISSEEEVVKQTTTKRKNKRTSTITTVLAVTTSETIDQKNALRNINFNNKEINERNDRPEQTKVTYSGHNHKVMTYVAASSTQGNMGITQLPKDSRKSKRINPKVNAFRNLLKIANANRKRKDLFPPLIQINNKKKYAGRGKLKSFRNVQDKVLTGHRRFLPSHVFNDSEYSNEEEDLKNNLYDAFRHKDEVYYRRNMRHEHEFPLKEELRKESGVTDEEIILKQNIYKAIKENNRRSNH